ncbi:MAG: hypothetical protein J5X22_20865 [Candidatus Accumulibacter sp.]|uniref:hypothetical protein n=1 Tax=Accumulibacter sp. TaxID=2053492 RepID=UPI001AC36303|nr:hypothetical protein [Accumulibacter sp.]MBN8519794.1 hypothetical protein [Accumulibacter sp.]MBO3712849.1 hypothetical protein [Accumulibacter sp.]
MSVVVLINGREAIPVRAIPYMADSTVSAEILVRGVLCSDHNNALHGLSAYQLLAYECSRKVQPVEWRRVAVNLHALSDTLRRQELKGELTHAEGTAEWKRESVKRLPSGVYIWKDEFSRKHFERYRRLSNEELAQCHRHGLEMNRELASASDDSYTAEIMAAHGAPENWREAFQADIDEAAAEGPFNPDSFCVYVPRGCEPKETDTLSDVTFSPWIEQDEMLVVMEGFEGAPRAGTKSDERQSASRESDDQQTPNEAIEDPAPARFVQRAMQDGFDKITREKAGERNFEAKVAAVNLSDERCIELAHSHELRIADWTALTGIGIGVHWSYVVSAEGVAFRKWTEGEISEASVDRQIEMHQDNEAAPLKFPCTPAMIILFIDAAQPGSHSFSVPDAFRQAVTESAQATDTAPQAPDEAQEQRDAARSGAQRVTPADDSPTDDDETDELLPDDEKDETKTPAERRAVHDIAKERGCRRMILANWDTIEKLHGSNPKCIEIWRIVVRNLQDGEKKPVLKTVRNNRDTLRKAGLIP